MDVIQFDEHHGVLLDEQGIMWPKSAVEALMVECQRHLAHSDLELMALGRMSVERKGQNVSMQFNFEEYYP
jgi:hypothetical protein